MRSRTELWKGSAVALIVLFACSLTACSTDGARVTVANRERKPKNAPTSISGWTVHLPRGPEQVLRPGSSRSGEGVIERTNRSPRGRVFLDFNTDPDAPDAFGLVIDPENLAGFPADPETHYLGKRVRVTGQVVTFDGHAEMHPRTAQVIQILGPSALQPVPASSAPGIGFPERRWSPLRKGRYACGVGVACTGGAIRSAAVARTSQGQSGPFFAWSIDVPAQPSFAQVAQAADGTSYIALEEGGVVAVSATGQIRWRFTPPVACCSPSLAVGPDALFTSAPPTAPSSR